jgi:hypothetical protein
MQNRYNIVLKARQLGLSTVTAGYAVWMLIFHKNANILVIATKLKTAKNFLKKCKYMIENLPPWMKQFFEIVKNDAQTLETSKGSQLQAVPTSEDAGRSEALSLLIVDEAAFVRDFDELWKGLQPTLSTGGSAILLSTPNGTGNKFYDIWRDAEKGDNDFNPIKLPWSVHPERDEKWFKQQTRNMTKKDIAQEHECNFLASGDTFLDSAVLEFIHDSIKNPIRREGIDRQIWVWKDPQPKHKYIVSADVARGDAKDYSAFHVIDAEIGEQVAEYQGRLPPDRFAEMLDQVGRRYNNAVLCPENNSIGYATIQKLCELKYPNIYSRSRRTLDLWSYEKSTDTLRPSGDLGMFTSGGRRVNILTKLEELLRNQKIKIYSQRTYAELQTFVWISENKVGAQGRNHDDLVMSLAIGLWLVDTDGLTQFSGDHNKALLDSLTQSSVKLDDVISKDKQDDGDYNVFLPVAGNGASQYGSSVFKKPSGQMLNKKWSWLMQ